MKVNFKIVTLQHVIHRQLVWPAVLEFQMTASQPVQYLLPHMQLNNGRGAWEPKTTTDPTDYLQIDLLYEYVICAVATQGNPPTQSVGAQEWTTEYKLRFSLNGTTFLPYKENKLDKVGMSCSCTQVFTTAKMSSCVTKLKLFTRTKKLLIPVI